MIVFAHQALNTIDAHIIVSMSMIIMKFSVVSRCIATGSYHYTFSLFAWYGLAISINAGWKNIKVSMARNSRCGIGTVSHAIKWHNLLISRIPRSLCPCFRWDIPRCNSDHSLKILSMTCSIKTHVHNNHAEQWRIVRNINLNIFQSQHTLPQSDKITLQRRHLQYRT